MSDTLDITGMPQRGQALIDEINNAVADTQRILLTPLPSFILMTSDQYTSLLPFEDRMMAMTDYSVFTDLLTVSKDMFFYTPHNVMEVRVAEASHVA